MRRAQPRKRRHKHHAAAVGHAARQCLHIAALADQAQTIAQPLHHRATDKHRTLQRILRLACERTRQRGQQSLLTQPECLADVLQQKASRAVGVLRIAGPRAHLPKQRALLIARDAGNLNAFQPQRGAHRSKPFARPDHLWHHRPRHPQQPQQFVVPPVLHNVVEQGPRRVGAVGDMALAACQVPDQPAIDGAERKLTTLRLLARAPHVVQNPGHLGAAEVRVQPQTAASPHLVLGTIAGQLFAL